MWAAARPATAAAPCRRRAAPAAVIVAPVQYSLLIWGTMYGYLVFAELPDLWTWVGALTIMATGLYTLHRERVVARSGRSAGAR